MDEIDHLFPKKQNGRPSYRKGQRGCIDKAIEMLIDNDYNLFIVDAPVGFGKSAVLYTIAKVFAANRKFSFYTTPQKVLQDQLNTDYVDIPMIKGRANYVCKDDRDVMCDCGKCLLGMYCDYNVSQNEDGSLEVPEDLCYYVDARIKALRSYVCNINPSYLMTNAKIRDRQLLICDESQSIPESAIGFLGVNLPAKTIGNIPFYKEFDKYLEWLQFIIMPMLTQKLIELTEELPAINNKTDKRKMFRLLHQIEQTGDRVNLLLRDYEENQEEWIVDKKENYIHFNPITSGRFLKEKFWCKGEKVILSSGTIIPDYYLKEAGLLDYEFTKDCIFSAASNFSSARSPIFYKSIGSMNQKSKATTFPKIMAEINDIIRRMPNTRGIIHCHSYSNATYVANNIANDLKHLVMLQDNENRDESLKRWLNDNRPASVFVSVAMTEGLDLKDDLCRYQIYIKMAYRDRSDPRVAKRLELGHKVWDAFGAIEDLEQASGRATRSEMDWSYTIVLDNAFWYLYKEYAEMFKPWFKQRVRVVPINGKIDL